MLCFAIRSFVDTARSRTRPPQGLWPDSILLSSQAERDPTHGVRPTLRALPRPLCRYASIILRADHTFLLTFLSNVVAYPCRHSLERIDRWPPPDNRRATTRVRRTRLLCRPAPPPVQARWLACTDRLLRRVRKGLVARDGNFRTRQRHAKIRFVARGADRAGIAATRAGGNCGNCLRRSAGPITARDTARSSRLRPRACSGVESTLWPPVEAPSAFRVAGAMRHS